MMEGYVQKITINQAKELPKKCFKEIAGPLEQAFR